MQEPSTGSRIVSIKRRLLTLLAVSMLLCMSAPAQASHIVPDIGVVKDSGTADVISQYEDLNLVEFDAFDLALRALENGEVDFLASSHTLVADVEVKRDYPEFMVESFVGDTTDYVPIVRKDTTSEFGNIELLQAVNTALAMYFDSGDAEISHGTWFSDNSAIEESDWAASLADSWPDSITEGGRLDNIINVEPELLFCTFDQDNSLSSQDEDGELIGFEIEIAEAISGLIGGHYGIDLAFRLIEVSERGDVFNELLTEDQCDVGIGSLTSGEAIAQGLRGGIPYYTAGTVIVSTPDSPHLPSFVEKEEIPSIFDDDGEFDKRLILIGVLLVFIAYRIRNDGF